LVKERGNWFFGRNEIFPNYALEKFKGVLSKAPSLS